LTTVPLFSANSAFLLLRSFPTKLMLSAQLAQIFHNRDAL